MPLHLISHKKLVCEKCEKNISNRNYSKLRNYLFKMKELDQIILQGGLFTSNKGHFCLAKGYFDNPERQIEVAFPPNWKLFLITFIHIKKKNFSKMILLTKCPISGRFIYYERP